MIYKTMNWVILQIENEGETFYKVLAQVGLGSEDWRINSGITDVTSDKYFYYIHGSSGSVYECAKEAEYLSVVIDNLLDRLPYRIKIASCAELKRKNYLLNP